MRALTLFLLLTTLCLGPGWAVEVPSVGVDSGASAVVVIHAPPAQQAESPVRLVGPDAPERSLPQLMARAPRHADGPALRPRAPHRRPALHRWAASPARHVELCVFLR
ncbi:MAG: hypothetical protein AAGE94_15015 [Acidobacteriota bacterium]